MKRLLKISALAFLLVSCLTVNGQTPAAVTEKERMALIDSLSNPMLAEGSEVMCFEAFRIEAGEMNEDSEPSEYVFRWTNAGSKPLSVTFVQTTCGCAAPSYSREPVMPGATDSIKVTYHPKGHPGGFRRRIFVYTNLSAKQPSAVVELTGKVIPSVMPTADYPVSMGKLLLKRSFVEFPRDVLRTERIECLNAGDRTLEIDVDTKTLPAGIIVEPLKIAPGEVADLILRVDPSKAEKFPEYVPVFLRGIPFPLTKCMIIIRFE